MSTYYPDGMLVRGENDQVYVFAEGQAHLIAGPLILDPKTPDVTGSYLERLPLLSGLMPENFPLGASIELGIPIEVTKEDEITSDMPRRYMRTSAALARAAARLDCVTETWTRQPWIGFTGGVIVALATGEQDGPGEYLWNSDLQQFGVDGFRIPFKLSRRVDQWSQSMPPDVAQRATQIRILHTHAPRIRILQQLEEIVKTTKDIIIIVKSITALVP